MSEKPKDNPYYRNYWKMFGSIDAQLEKYKLDIYCPICKATDSFLGDNNHGFVFLVCNNCGHLMVSGLGHANKQTMERIK